MTEKFEKHIPVTGHKQTVLDCLSQQTEISRQQLKRIMQNGAVWLETTHGIDRIRRAKKTLKAGDILHIYYDPAVQDEKPADAQLIANEGDYSIWNKPGACILRAVNGGIIALFIVGLSRMLLLSSPHLSFTGLIEQLTD